MEARERKDGGLASVAKERGGCSLYRDATLDDLNMQAVGPRNGARAAPKPGFFVDLGDAIGTRAWWRGMVSLLAMLVMAFWIASTPARLPAHAAAPLGTAQLAALGAVSLSSLADGGHSGARAAASALVTPLGETPERPRIELTAELGGSDSFSGAMRRAGVGLGDIDAAATLIGDHVDIASLSPGTAFDVVLGRRSDRTKPRPLEALSFRAAFDLQLELERGEGGALAMRAKPIRIDETPLRVSGFVGDSLYKSARAAGLSSRIVANFIQAMSPRLNFQRNVYASDEFDVVVEHRRAETGETQTGDLLYARVEGNGKNLEIAAWQKDGKTQYFLPDGKGVKEGMSLSPVRGARLSSGFGMRRHPVLRRTRMHKGLDYAARSGTPIESTASGKVIFAGRNGGYGNQVRVRHVGGIVTSYSHMKGFASGIRSGTAVSQGQKIGYVGSTGLSTGPHLHYEGHVAGSAVDPRSQKLPNGMELSGGELRRFQSEIARLRSISPLGGDAGGDEGTETAAVEKKDTRKS